MREPVEVDRSNLAPLVSLVERVIAKAGAATEFEIQVVVVPPPDERPLLRRMFRTRPGLGVEGRQPLTWLSTRPNDRDTLHAGVTCGGRRDLLVDEALARAEVTAPARWQSTASMRATLSFACPTMCSPVEIAQWLFDAADVVGAGLGPHRIVAAPVVPTLRPVGP